MNNIDSKYSQFYLVKEMLETVSVVKNFNASQTKSIAEKIQKTQKLFLTGEGSSRIFPAKNCIRKANTWKTNIFISTENSRQAHQYDLSSYSIFMASNSGRTKEVVSLANHLKNVNNQNLFCLTANTNTLLEKYCTESFILKCGTEQAVAATKSVIEQALFFESILWNILNKQNIFNAEKLSELIKQALNAPIEKSIAEIVANATTIYFAGYNDGVAEELTLKTNEITRKKSDYLEGTYAVHGIEEVMSSNDVVILIDPIEEEIDKFYEVLVKGVGLKVIAITNKEVPFLKINIPEAKEFNPYIYLCAGWNLLVEVGLLLGINLDKPQRARKIGNEFVDKNT